MKKNTLFCFLKRKTSYLIKCNLKMKFSFLLILFSIMQIFSNEGYSQKKITFHLQNVTIKQALNEIKNQTDYKFLYREGNLNLNKRITLKVINQPTKLVLNRLFKNTKIDYKIIEKQIVLTKKTNSFDKPNITPPIIIKGVVSDNTGNPLPGVSIQIKGTTKGTTTDFNGEYSITVDDENAILVFSYIGFKDKELVVQNSKKIDVTLEEDLENLDEIVVTSLGIKKSKKALGYAVTTIDSKEVSKRPEADLARTLQGKVAGLSIGTANGQTGSGSPIRIRGSISLNQSNAPLIIVNNVPFSGLLRDIDPNDIKSMNVLKGFNAAVLYGSEGRNGVILIQTKSGSGEIGESKTTASFSVNTYTNVVSQLPEYQNTYGVGQDYSPIYGLANFGPRFSDVDQIDHPFSNNPDFSQFSGVTVPYEAKPNNVKNIFRQGQGKIYSANVTTSQEKVAYSMSVGYTDEEGIVANNDLKRFNIGLGGNAQLTDKLNVAATLNYSTRKVNRIQATSVFNRVFYLPRNIDLTELPYQNPVTGESVYYNSREADTNPLWLLNNAAISDDIVRVFGTVNSNYKFNDNLNLSYRVGYDSEQFERFDYSNRGGTTGAFQLGYLNIDNEKRVVIDQTLIFSFNKDLTDDLNLEAQIGGNSKLTRVKTTFSDSEGQIVYGFLRPSNFTNSTVNYETEDQNIAGVFGQFQLGYKNYLYATLSGRNDWGSTVEKENRTLFYPGASVSFIPTSAFDFGDDSFVRYLKVRAAYATSSGFPDPYRTRNTLLINAQRFAAADGTLPVTNRFSSIYANPDLNPELHREFEIGLETKLFRNRVTLETSLYKRVSEDQIVASPLNLSSGFDTQFINLGQVDNKGIEVDLGIDIFKREDFNWNMRNIFTAEESLVVKTTETGGIIQLNADRVAAEGHPLNAIFGTYAVRDANGNLLVRGGTGTQVGRLIRSTDVQSLPDEKVIGDPNPDWRLTNIHSVSYKNFTFSTQLEYTHGGDISSENVLELIQRGVTRDTENRDGSFVIPGFYGSRATGLPLLDAAGNQIPNTTQLSSHRAASFNYYDTNETRMFDASVFRIREVSFAYTLNKADNSKLPFDKIDFTLSGRNLWYVAPNFPKYTNFDPESDGGLGRNSVPSTKRFALGVTVTF